MGMQVHETRQHCPLRQVPDLHTRRRASAGRNRYNLVSFHLDEGVLQRLLAPSINQFSRANRNPRRRLSGSYDRKQEARDKQDNDPVHAGSPLNPESLSEPPFLSLPTCARIECWIARRCGTEWVVVPLAGVFIVEKSVTISWLLGIRSQRSSASSGQPEFQLSGFARLVFVVLVAE